MKKRKFNSKTAFKILDAPDLINDYNINIIDWSNNDLLSVALGRNVHVLD